MSSHMYDDLMNACDAGNIEEVERLTFVNFSNARDACLSRACAANQLKMVKWLVEHGADVNAGIKNSCVYNRYDILLYLIEKDATALNMGLYNACSSGHYKIVKLLITNGANNFNECLLRACQRNYYDIVKLLIANGANNLNDGLYEACRGHYGGIIRFLLLLGAYVTRDLCNNNTQRLLNIHHELLHDDRLNNVLSDEPNKTKLKSLTGHNLYNDETIERFTQERNARIASISKILDTIIEHSVVGWDHNHMMFIIGSYIKY